MVTQTPKLRRVREKEPHSDRTETYTQVKRDLYTGQKRPIHRSKETYTQVKRDLYIGQKRPADSHYGMMGVAGGAEPHAGRLVGEHVDAIFKMVYGSTFNTAIQALQVLLQATICNDT